MTVELLFDGFEDHVSVQPQLKVLEALSSIQDLGSKQAPTRRPHHCVVAWDIADTRPFSGVITSLSTRLLMFAPSGAPLRASCTVQLTEVHVLSRVGKEGSAVREVVRAVRRWASER
jgi:hypothetical protein